MQCSTKCAIRPPGKSMITTVFAGCDSEQSRPHKSDPLPNLSLVELFDLVGLVGPAGHVFPYPVEVRSSVGRQTGMGIGVGHTHRLATEGKSLPWLDRRPLVQKCTARLNPGTLRPYN